MCCWSLRAFWLDGSVCSATLSQLSQAAMSMMHLNMTPKAVSKLSAQPLLGTVLKQVLHQLLLVPIAHGTELVK